MAGVAGLADYWMAVEASPIGVEAAIEASPMAVETSPVVVQAGLQNSMKFDALGVSRRHLEASRRHLGGIWSLPGGFQRPRALLGDLTLLPAGYKATIL